MNIQKVKEKADDIKYYIGNPSAWEHYDDSVSEKIWELVSSIEALAEIENQDESCTWSGPDDEGLYRGSCGMNEWSCIDGTPEENGMVYCHKCGKKIKHPVVDYSPMLDLPKKINRCVDW